MLSPIFPPKIDYKEFHHFNGKVLLFDIKSCRLFYISPIISDLLRVSKTIEDNNYSALRETLLRKYNVSELERATNALKSLVRYNLNLDKDRINSRRGIGRIYLDVTSDCNLNCVYCLCSVSNSKRAIKYMDKGIARLAIDYLFENSKDWNQVDIYFYGGEPLLNFPLVEYTVKYAKNKSKEYNKSVKFLINTNGTLLSRKIINFLDEHFSAIGLSLDGDKTVHDSQRPYKASNPSLSSHKNVTKYLPIILELFKDKLHISVVQNPNNPQGLSIYRYFKKLKIMYLKLEPCFISLSPEFRTDKMNISRVLTDQVLLFKEYVKDIKNKNSLYIEDYWTVIREILFGSSRRFSCGAGRNVVTVSVEGDIFSCHRATHDAAFKLGNLKSGIDREKQGFYLSRFCDTFVKCKKCWARTLCGGGCMWINIHTLGKKEEVADCRCQLQKLLITQSIQLIEELFADKIPYIN